MGDRADRVGRYFALGRLPRSRSPFFTSAFDFERWSLTCSFVNLLPSSPEWVSSFSGLIVSLGILVVLR